MVKKPESRLTQAKRLIEKEMDWIVNEIVDRSQKYSKSTQSRLELTTCFGARLAVLHILYDAIIHAQRAGATEVSPQLREGLMSALKLPSMHLWHDSGQLTPLSTAIDIWWDKEKFIELISSSPTACPS